MKAYGTSRSSRFASQCLGFCVLVAGVFSAANALGEERFRVSSSTFANNGVLPISTIYNFVSGTANACSADGSAGGDQSPELTWTHAPRGTHSFVVVMFDVTASFTHWGMYDIPAWTNSLPAGAGAAGSTYGAQVYNDFYDQNYDGPCPPAGVQPYSHQYVLTVYALDKELRLPSSANFPPYAETLWYALVRAAEEGHVLGTASINGYYSATPSP